MFIFGILAIINSRKVSETQYYCIKVVAQFRYNKYIEGVNHIQLTQYNEY